MDKEQESSESTEAPAIDSGTAKSSAQESDHELQLIKEPLRCDRSKSTMRNHSGGSTIRSKSVPLEDEKDCTSARKSCHKFFPSVEILSLLSIWSKLKTGFGGEGFLETLTAIKPFIDCIIEVVTLHRCPLASSPWPLQQTTAAQIKGKSYASGYRWKLPHILTLEYACLCVCVSPKDPI